MYTCHSQSPYPPPLNPLPRTQTLTPAQEHARAHTHTRTHAQTDTRTRISTHAQTDTQTHVHTPSFSVLCRGVKEQAELNYRWMTLMGGMTVCVCVCVCMCVCVCVSMCAFIKMRSLLIIIPLFSAMSIIFQHHDRLFFHEIGPFFRTSECESLSILRRGTRLITLLCFWENRFSLQRSLLKCPFLLWNIKH
jgi:hypothetical protein